MKILPSSDQVQAQLQFHKAKLILVHSAYTECQIRKKNSNSECNYCKYRSSKTVFVTFHHSNILFKCYKIHLKNQVVLLFHNSDKKIRRHIHFGKNIRVWFFYQTEGHDFIAVYM